MVCASCGSPVEGAFCSKCGARVQPPPPPNYDEAARLGYAAPPQAPPAGYGVPPQVPPGYPGYAVPAIPYVPRVHGHLKTVGILWCVYGAYRAFAGIAASFFLFGLSHGGFFERFGGDRSFPFASMAPMMGSIAAVVAIMTLVGSVLAFLTGFALLNRKSWGRILAIVAAVLALIKIPIGTAIGIYTLWVLAPSRSGLEYDAIAERGSF